MLPFLQRWTRNLLYISSCSLSLSPTPSRSKSLSISLSFYLTFSLFFACSLNLIRSNDFQQWQVFDFENKIMGSCCTKKKLKREKKKWHIHISNSIKLALAQCIKYSFLILLFFCSPLGNFPLSLFASTRNWYKTTITTTNRF